jgi:hypothetical protein
MHIVKNLFDRDAMMKNGSYEVDRNRKKTKDYVGLGRFWVDHIEHDKQYSYSIVHDYLPLA